MSEATTLLAAGELLAEFVAVGEDGRPIDAAREPLRLFAGPFPSGAPAIAIDQAARCGARTMMFGSVGADVFGEAICERLAEGGTDISGIARDPLRPTGTAHVAYRGDGSRSFVFHIEGTAAEHAAVASVPADPVLLVSGSTLGLPALRAAVLDAAVKVKRAGGRIALDPNVRPELMREEAARRAIEVLVDGAFIATPSEEDLAVLMPGLSVADAAKALHARGVEVVAVTRGARGAFVSGMGAEIDLAGHAVDAVDPTGAGDAFCATLAATLTAGATLAEAARLANAAGALAVMRLGPMEGNSRIAEVAAMAARQPGG